MRRRRAAARPCWFLPHASTEHGAKQTANVLSSLHAVEMRVFVVRAFVKLREMLEAANT
jgi:hypothetical protein